MAESTVKQRLIEFIKYRGLSQSRFEKAVGLSNGFVNNISKGIGGDKLQRIIGIYPDLSADWLITGKGEMLKNKNEFSDNSVNVVSENSINFGNSAPLYDAVAAAGYGSFDELLGSKKITENYVLPPEFKRVDFLIRVAGDSMSPHYIPGDIIACRIIKESQFIQWGKVYVAATKEQGFLVKRLDTDHDSIIALSDNPRYKPFTIEKDQICGVALVVGLIRAE